MTRLIRAQCVQILVRRSNEDCSHNIKHIKVNPVPGWNTEINFVPTPFRGGIGAFLAV
jgi:hypothetical protein